VSTCIKIAKLAAKCMKDDAATFERLSAERCRTFEIRDERRVCVGEGKALLAELKENLANDLALATRACILSSDQCVGACLAD
jgi:hypothetical protein